MPFSPFLSGEKIFANVIISGSGALHVPKIPSFKGIEQFQGDSFHTALWRKDYNPQGFLFELIIRCIFKYFCRCARIIFISYFYFFFISIKF